MELKNRFKFTLSDKLKLVSAIHDYEAMQRGNTDIFEIWWTEDGEEDYTLYQELEVKRSIKEGDWIIINWFTLRLNYTINELF